jgi:hypothetical protein
MHDMRRQIIRHQLRSLDLPTLCLIIAVVSLLAGCSKAPMSSPMAATRSQAPTSTATSAKINSTMPSDCLSGQSPTDAASFKPDVIVSQNSDAAGVAQSITLAQGQRLEIRLQSMFNWVLMISGTSNALAITGPQGWYNASLKMCVWRFTAIDAGEVRLDFEGTIVCPPLKLCPSIEESATYQVTVR